MTAQNCSKYYVRFEDPDGIRLEVNFVPGAGLLADGAQFNPVAGYVSGSGPALPRRWPDDPPAVAPATSSSPPATTVT
jgi:hypothetical protein